MNLESFQYILRSYKLLPGDPGSDPRPYPYNSDELLNFPLTNYRIDEPLPAPPVEISSEPPQASFINRLQEIYDKIYF